MVKSGKVSGEALAGVEIFAALELDTREEIAGFCAGHSFSEGDTILSYLDEDRHIYFVISGIVEVSLYSMSGKRVSFLDKGPGQLVGELAAIDGAPRSATVTAKSDCQLASMPADAFLKVISGNPIVAGRLLRRLASQVRELSARVFEFNALCVKNRIHVELVRAARDAPGDGDRRLISPAPTHAAIASRVSTHREAVTREMGQLVKSGLLEKTSDGLVVTDLTKLQELVEESLGDVPVIC